MHTPVLAITKICNSPLEISGQYSESKEKLTVEAGTKMIIPVHDIQM